MARYSTYRTEAVGSLAANKGARTVMRALAYHLAALKFPTFQCKNQSESTQIVMLFAKICVELLRNKYRETFIKRCLFVPVSLAVV